MNTSPEFRSLLAEDILEFPLTGIRLIEASAGTGKTYTIASLFVRYVLAEIPNDKILVVTFTNAATEELRGRIRARLFDLLRLLQKPQSCDDHFFNLILKKCADQSFRQQTVDRLKRAIRTMDEAAIYTIHGFCQRVLTDHAFNSGQAYDTELTPDQNELWKQATEDWWRIQAYELTPDRLSLFLRALKSLDDFTALLGPFRSIQPPTLRPQITESLQDLYGKSLHLKPDLRKLAEIWNSRSSEITRILTESKALGRSQKSPYSKERLPGFIENINNYFQPPGPSFNLDILSFLSAHSLDKYSKPSRRGKEPELKDQFFIRCQLVTERMEDLVYRFRSRALFEAMQFFGEQIEGTKIKRRIMTYDDLLTRLYKALNDSRTKNLASDLRQSFPIAMIDEFQDTDAIQYGIFRQIYRQETKTALTLIGDPKQSIYSFRGSDVFIYMQARKDTGNKGYTLETNRRSSAGLIKAVNSFFSLRTAPFIYDSAIGFSPAKHTATNGKPDDRIPLVSDSLQGSPLTLWKIPFDTDGKPYTTGKAHDLLARATAAQIARLFSSPTPQTHDASDIAILVRTNREGEMIHTELRNLGIAAVTMARDNIFESDEANGLEILLMAIAEPTNQQQLRNALSSRLLEWNYLEMDQIWTDEIAWQAWVDSVRNLSKLWKNKGFMAMFQHLLHHHRIGESIAEPRSASSPVERRLTNLMHLAEMLQQASKQHPAPSSLLAWFAQQRHQSGNQEAEPRLESDEALVKIVTIHSSKGLEYPIVFLPFLWSCKPKIDMGSNLIEFHDNSGKTWLDAGTPQPSRNQAHCRAEKERLAEDLRLLYVALTRAQSKIYLAWGPVNSGTQEMSGKSALAYLLQSQQSPDDLDSQLPSGSMAGMDWDDALNQLVEQSEGNIEICELPNLNPKRTTGITVLSSVKIEVDEFKGSIATDWRIASFTGMTRDIHQPPHQGSRNPHNDPILDFPAGSRTGTFMHLILENLDFQGSIENQAASLWQQFSSRFNLDTKPHQETLKQWLINIVNTRIDHEGLKLRELPNYRRLNELEFDFSVAPTDMAALNRLLNVDSKNPAPMIEYENFQGAVNGVIDLVFEHKGRFYIADYKTNYLGGVLNDYLPEKLYHAMINRRYDLQYLLYTVALHRYLKQRIPNYRYEKHFGGVCYLFLRAMRPDDRELRGIFQVLPEKNTVEKLDEIVFSQALGRRFCV